MKSGLLVFAEYTHTGNFYDGIQIFSGPYIHERSVTQQQTRAATARKDNAITQRPHGLSHADYQRKVWASHA